MMRTYPNMTQVPGRLDSAKVIQESPHGQKETATIAELNQVLKLLEKPEKLEA